jgi:gliding motility-associated-like protein
MNSDLCLKSNRNDFKCWKNILILIFVVASHLTVLADDYYWVGGSGLWSDINNWATTSGGTVLYNQPPTANNNVIFDQNSFPSSDGVVNINLKNAVCRDMIWTGVSNSPTLLGADTSSLRIYGSLTLDSGMHFNYQQSLYFESISSGKIITSAGHIFHCEVIFQGNGGGWTFQDDFISSNSVSLLYGALSTNNHRFECTSFSSLSGETRGIHLGASEVYVNQWEIDGSNLTLDAQSSYLYVLYSLTNSNGLRLVYNNLDFTGPSSTLSNTNVKAVFRNVRFQNGSVSGDFIIDSLMFQGSASITGNDSINYLHIAGSGILEGGTNVISYLECNASFQISGENIIDSILIDGNSEITGENILGVVMLRSQAIIAGNNEISQLTIARRARISGGNLINWALLNGNSHLSGSNVFDVLNFTPGRTYLFGINSTLTINNELNASGTCYEPIRMLSDTNGVQSTIIKHNGAFISEYLSLRDLNAQGAIPFIANNSVDLGNNSNWNIGSSSGKDLFWVNGSGLWSDPTNWDVVSGGPGGHCPPTEFDNAIFDQNSFSESGQQVLIDVMSAVCKDMNWENAGLYSPELSGPDTLKILIYGSLNFSESIINDFFGQVLFEATEPGKTIVSANIKFNDNVWFNGRGGEWSLIDRFRTDRNIYFQNGSLKTLGNKLACQTFSSTDTTTRILDLSVSTVELMNIGTDVWLLNGYNLTLKADSSLLRSFDNGAYITTFGTESQRFIYNNVEFFGNGSTLLHSGAYCVYNNVKFFQYQGSVRGDCTIDSITFYQPYGSIFDSDTIGTAIFYGAQALVQGGSHVIGIGYFYGDAIVEGNNTIDTALFFRNAVITGTNTIDTMIVHNRMHMQGENVFRTATLLGEGHIFGTNTFSDLNLTRANAYFFEHSKTQTIIDNLNIQGACTGLIGLQSDENSVQATIHKVNGGVNGDFLLLRDILASGGQLPFTATNSVDLGNNQGWEITMGEPKDLYWVNGSGVWSDSLHWAGISGGMGGYCIPTPIDNVFFDHNSFITTQDTVKLDLADATCRNMDWTGATGAPVLLGSDTVNLRIYGSLTLNNNLLNEFPGSIYLEATNQGHSIESKGVWFNGSVTFQGIGGEWTLLDDFKSGNHVFLKRGKLNLGQNNIRCFSFNSNFIYPRELDISNAQITLTGDNIEAWHLNTISLQFNGDQSTIISQGVYGLLLTQGGGSINYHNILKNGSDSRIYNINTRAGYNTVIFSNNGSIHGNCNIDTLIFGGIGSVYDSDSINYLRFHGTHGHIVGGNHVINTLLFDAHGNISGNNVIDTTIIYGQGNIAGNNKISKTLIIGQGAVISGQNEFGNTVLMGNGDISGPNTFKSLRLTPGNIYKLEPNINLTITENFHVRGNNCFPITIRSKSQGAQARISVPTGRVISGDFIELRDIAAIGGATFYAGNFSTDISNNSGWIFSNAPGYIFGFPAADTSVCSNDLAILGTQSFNPDENSTFLWHDGSTGNEYLIKPDDTLVWVRVYYAEECSYIDTILIYQLPYPFINLGDDKELCSLDTIFPVGFSENIQYLWHDGSTHDFMVATSSGNYSVWVTNDYGCMAYAQVFLNVLPTPEVNLGNDTIIRAGDFIVLDAGNPGAVYTWSTGETTRTITGYSGQTYWVMVEKDGCFTYDAISIGEHPPCILAVPSAFSPNGDGVNDILFVRGSNFTEFELMIFSRWGEMVFQTTDISQGWDGTFKGKPSPVDAYNYYLRGTCVDGHITTSKGTITLLR